MQALIDGATLEWFRKKEHCEVWFGGDEPWLWRWLGLSEFWEIASIYAFAIWQRAERKFITDAIWCTNAAEATYRTGGGPCMQHRGCMRPPLIPSDRWRFVQCILHGLMAIGRLICTYIKDSVENYHDSKGIAINKILKTCRVRWSLGKTPKPTGECTWRLMLHAWPLIAQWLGIVGTRADKDVEDMLAPMPLV